MSDISRRRSDRPNLTKSGLHEFKTEFFKALLTTVDVVWDIRIKYLVICFLVSADRAQTFKVKEPTLHGCLQKYYVLGDQKPKRKWGPKDELECVKICSPSKATI
jgi:hypothetical protein